jgi:ribosomal protein L37E
MTATTASDTAATEYQEENCENCGDRTPHSVRVELEAAHNEEVRDENEKFARTPCRVATCRRCGATSYERRP